MASATTTTCATGSSWRRRAGVGRTVEWRLCAWGGDGRPARPRVAAALRLYFGAQRVHVCVRLRSAGLAVLALSLRGWRGVLLFVTWTFARAPPPRAAIRTLVIAFNMAVCGSWEGVRWQCHCGCGFEWDAVFCLILSCASESTARAAFAACALARA